MDNYPRPYSTTNLLSGDPDLIKSDDVKKLRHPSDEMSKTSPDVPGPSGPRGYGDSLLSAKKKNVEYCVVCGDIASGYHYNALSCEGCKGFFRRSIMRNANYVCNYGGNCEMDTWMRRKCQACRLKRCRDVGMRAEFLLSMEQCRARRSRRKTQPKSCSGPPSSPGSASVDLGPDSSSGVRQRSQPSTPEEEAQFVKSVMKTEECYLINHLVVLQNKYELPDENMQKKIKSTEELLAQGLTFQDVIFYKMSNYMILMTKLVVEFAKRIPGFNTISPDVQISLIKHSSNEVTILRASRRYDVETQSLVFPNGERMTLDNFCSLLDDPEPYEALFKFCEQATNLSLDNAEYALLTSLCLLVEHDIVDRSKQGQREDILGRLSNTLSNYCYAKTGSGVRYGRLMSLISELVVVGYKHAQMLTRIRTSRALHPLLEEFFGTNSQIPEAPSSTSSAPDLADFEIKQSPR